MKGLTVSVYRSAAHPQDFSLGGISGRFDSLTLTGIEDGVFEPTDKEPEIRLAQRAGYWIAVPVDAAGEPMLGGMFGGNFVYTSDGRLPGHLPLPVHDRFEGPSR